MAKSAFEDPALQDESQLSEKALRKAAKEKRKAEKQAAKAAAAEPELPQSDVPEKKSKKRKAEEEGPASGLSKEERKALKRARQEENAGGDDEAAAKAERKARRKAEKAAKANGTALDNGPMKSEKATTSGDYQEHGSLSALPQSEIDAFVEEKQLTIEDPQEQKLRPITLFKYLTLEDSQRAPFAGFKEPTPIQAACWPYLLAGRDVVGVAETGSGKTLAFGMPCIHYISSLDKAQKKNIKACIVSPTRELALQIQEQLVKVAEPAGLKVTCVYGGTNKDEQRAKLKGTHVVVATPGRLNDFIGEGSIDLSNVGYLVLDEADRMLDKGFEEEMRKIISSTPEDARQTLMFTATWPPSVRSLAETFMRKPVKVTIGDNASGELRANKRVTQQVEVIDQRDKQDRLFQLLKQYQSGKNKHDRILVFCLYKKEASRIEEFIRRKGFPVAGIHGDLNQQKRQESLEAFKNGSTPLLVATDVAARGLDIPAVKVVINVTFPLTAEDYVHRIGRTGRAGQDGLAITLFTENEKALSGALINVLKAAGQPVPEELLKFGTTVKKKGHEAYGAFYKDTGDMPKAKKITFD